jgi:hypothetical protein
MKVNVRVVGTVRPQRPITPIELANAVRAYVGKTFEIEIAPTKTVQDLADAVDIQLGVSPSETFDEVLMEQDVVLDKTATLAAAGVADGDSVSYRFVINIA